MYAELLGPAWLTLPESIRKLHESGTCRHGVGDFRVRSGNAVGRLIARIARMPSAAESVAVGLVVTPQPGGEQWRRKFGGAPLVSVQWIDGDSIRERFGAVEVRFRLEAAESELRYVFDGGSIWILGLPVPLPLIASAYERARRGVDNGIDVSVDVAMKGIGRIIAYDGTLTRIDVDR